jgi:DNA polymerase III epsilon subunit-like protein
VAYNALFDYEFLRHCLLKNNYEGLSNDVLDPLTILRDRRPYPHKLADAITYYELNEKCQNSHRGIDDVKALYYVLEEMIKENDNISTYINRIGYIPKYGQPKSSNQKLEFFAQPYKKSY